MGHGPASPFAPSPGRADRPYHGSHPIGYMLSRIFGPGD